MQEAVLDREPRLNQEPPGLVLRGLGPVGLVLDSQGVGSRVVVQVLVEVQRLHRGHRCRIYSSTSRTLMPTIFSCQAAGPRWAQDWFTSVAAIALLI